MIDDTIYYNVPEDEVLLSLIRRENGWKPLTPGVVTIGVPAPRLPDEAIDKNTSVLLTARNNTIYSGQHIFYYNRANIVDFVRLFISNVTFTVTDEITSTDLIPKINERLGITLDVDSVIVETLPLGNVTYLFRVSPTSLVYSGELEIKLVR